MFGDIKDALRELAYNCNRSVIICLLGYSLELLIDGEINQFKNNSDKNYMNLAGSLIR